MYVICKLKEVTFNGHRRIWYSIKRSKSRKKDNPRTIGKICNTTKQVISRYERGERTPKITAAAEYAKKLDISLSFLLGEDVPMSEQRIEQYQCIFNHSLVMR